MDHFALPEDELAIARKNGSLQRNFQGYSTHKQSDMLGFGVTSIGKIGGVYYQNTKMEKDYMAGKLNYLYTKDYPTDIAIKLGQTMYETSLEVSKMEYINLLIIYGVFSQIAYNRYEMDVTFEDFWRMQKIVHEQSELYKDKVQGKKGMAHIG